MAAIGVVAVCATLSLVTTSLVVATAALVVLTLPIGFVAGELRRLYRCRTALGEVLLDEKNYEEMLAEVRSERDQAKRDFASLEHRTRLEMHTLSVLSSIQHQTSPPPPVDRQMRVVEEEAEQEADAEAREEGEDDRSHGKAKKRARR